jgi:hypothetical protein
MKSSCISFMPWIRVSYTRLWRKYEQLDKRAFVLFPGPCFSVFLPWNEDVLRNNMKTQNLSTRFMSTPEAKYDFHSSYSSSFSPQFPVRERRRGGSDETRMPCNFSSGETTQ